MKQYISLLLLILLIPASLFAQEEKYKSEEEDAYYQEWRKNYKSWEPLDENGIWAYSFWIS